MIQSLEAQAYLAAIVTSSDDAIISKDLNGIITSWNPAAERMFGYTTEEIIGQHVTLLIPSERFMEEEGILATLKRGERIEHFETERRHKNGSMVHVSLTVSPIRDSHGNVVGASKISRNISERVHTATMLREMSSKKEEFLANMSHELRTPMNAVIGLSNLLQKSKTLSDRDRTFVDTLKSSADNLLGLINDLLDFAKIESGQLLFEAIPFNLTEQVKQVIAIISVKAKEKELAIHWQSSPSLHRPFVGDPVRVGQMLTNLLSNAVKFTEHGGVTLEMSGQPGAEPNTTLVTIRVSDTGIGIAAEQQDAIFDKFMQADSSMTRRYGGSGLGLAITRNLVEQMGGSISVKSDLGMGSTFTVTLPLTHAEGVYNEPELTSVPVPRPHQHILLVEDYQPNVVVAGAMIELLGLGFDVANSGVEALRKFQQNTYDMVLMDVQMHEMDGMETARRMRRLEDEMGCLTRTPIVAMTAHVRDQDKEKCLESGMDDFIPKPFDPDLLTQKIRHYVAAGTHAA